jgi:hypothetical protein
MNFSIVSKQLFTAGINTYSRKYAVSYKKNGRLRIYNILNGDILFDDLQESEVNINGQPFTNAENLQKILFNKSCICDTDVDNNNFRIFDGSFDLTFE